MVVANLWFLKVGTNQVDSAEMISVTETGFKQASLLNSKTSKRLVCSLLPEG